MLWLLLPAPVPPAQSQYQNTRSPHGNLNLSCQNCHTVYGWKPIRAVPEFDHNLTKFPLRGMHEGVACSACHTKMVFSNVGNKCADCHADIHKRRMGANCESCHTVRGWKVSVQQINQHMNRFPLTGAHAAASCDACHKNGALSQFNTMSTACLTCHQKDFQAAKNPDHVAGKFATTCESCHSTDNWLNARFDHSLSGFPLTGMHTVPPRQCADCHINNNYNLPQTACVGCHLKDFQNANNPNHVQQGFSQTCESCHTTIGWSPANFDHSKSGFPLTGLHTVPPRACLDCHINNNYNLPQTACVGCHLKDFQSTNNPNHVQGDLPQTCEMCHTTSGWSPANFDHSKSGFPLTGLHTVPPRACADCHVNNNYNITQTTCVSCHLKDFQNTNNPNHAQQGFPQTCEVCHSTSGWSPAQFDHSKSGFPLTGLHTVPPRTCADCHINNNYNLTQTTCVSCHLKDFQNTNNPNHAQQGFPQTCEICHSTSGWSPAQFDHSKSGFPLTGLHTVPPRTCADCHINNNYNLTQTACVSCHLKDFQNTNNPNHAQQGFPQTCEICHTTSGWSPANFDHSKSGFPLTGLHTVPPRTCADCHINNNYNLTQTACVSCHLKDFQNTNNPNHAQQGFPQTCEVCHTTSGWSPANFDHSKSGFPLTGLHTVPPRTCADCHINNNYNLTQTACVSCHLKDYQNTNNPNHAQQGFPQTCEVCHSTSGWSPAQFDHSKSGFPLTGMHTVPPRACTDCHINNNYNITNTLCVSCHQTDYNNAKTPVDHIAANFPTTCETCHDTVAWTDGKFDHSQTGWALTGMHTVPPRTCTDCHINGNYKLNQTTCVTCHLNDFNNANNPNHVAAGFPTTCEVCHDTIAWTDAVFDHNKTPFPLTGSHMVPPRTCVDCHVNGNYTNLPTLCYGCHKTDYQNTNNPNHAAAGFPTTCDTCHNTTNWSNAVFNHTWFPTNHGNANGVCTTCHTNPNDFSVFTCTNCHTKTQTDQNHQGVNGYVYNSVNCYQCHKNGGGGG
jgi:NMD protein affecting ribosome stability and mRNA decay